MIELTPEQWQAIAQEENPTVIEPESKTAYIVVAKDECDEPRTVKNSEADAAYVLRIAWMRRMRLDEDEIAESLRDDPPVSVHEEMKQIKALDSLDKITPPGEVLRKYAIKYCNRSPVFDFHEIRDYKEGRKAGICQPIFSCLPAFLIKLSFL